MPWPLAAALLCCTPLFLGGCAAASYAGISFAPGAADPDLQSLAHRARAGDKQAQLELGIRFEQGVGVPVDLGRAERLYRLAAAPTPRRYWVYSPPVGDAPGAMLPIDLGPSLPGLSEARTRLSKLLAERNRR